MAFSSHRRYPAARARDHGTRSKPRILARHEVARSHLFAIESLELRFANGMNVPSNASRATATVMAAVRS